MPDAPKLDKTCPDKTDLDKIDTLNEADLHQAIDTTITYYDRAAESYRDRTWDHDVTQNYDALLDELQGDPPFAILDIGCGPGRDLLYFKSKGHEAVGLDGSKEFVEMARSQTGCTVWHQNFLSMDLPPARFDGVFANASLFHVPRQELPRILRELHATLKAGGVLFCSNPCGDNREGYARERYGCFHDLEAWRGFVTQVGFVEVDHFYRPTGLPRDQQPWLATVWRKPR